MLLSILGILKSEDFPFFAIRIHLTGLLHPLDLLMLNMLLVHTSVGWCIVDSLMQDTLQKVSLFATAIM